MRKPVVIGIAGGSGSGKTSIARAIFESLPEKSIVMLEHDSYYKDQSHLTFAERVKTNYDHPLAFDNELLLAHLNELLHYRPIEKPVYCFKTHTRLPETVHVEPRDIIILEGFLVLEDPKIRELLDIKIFVDTDPDVRIIRRILRDIRERGRSLESVVDQYMNTVRPMHLQFVEPTKRYADIIIPEGAQNLVAIDVVLAKIKAIMQEYSNGQTAV